MRINRFSFAATMKGIKRQYLITFAVIGTGLLILPLVSTDYVSGLFIMIYLYVIMAEAWNLVGGHIGEISLGHVAFFGVGAYAVALPIHHDIFIPQFLGVLVGGVCAALFAFVIGFPILRLRGYYFCIGTAAVAEILKVLFLNTSYELAGGAKGIYIPAPVPYSVMPYYYGAFALMLCTLLGMLIILRSRLALAFTAIRDSSDGAEMCGVHVALYKTIGLMLSAFFTGLAGAFFAYYRLWVDPTSHFTIMISFQILVIAYFGGLRRIEGALIATPIIIIITEVGRTMLRVQGYLIPLSLLMLLTVLLFPQGIAGVIRKKLRL